MHSSECGNGSFSIRTWSDGASRVRKNARTIDRWVVYSRNGYQISRIYSPLPGMSNQPIAQTSTIWIVAADFSPGRPIHTLIIDFILVLPKFTEKFNCAMFVTDKFNKAVTDIPGKTTWTTKQWATALFDRLILLGWGVPKIIISDRDKKFVSDLWKHIFNSLNVNLIYFTTWYPQTDGMSKKFNQTAEIVFRYYITTFDDIKTWPKVFFACRFLWTIPQITIPRLEVGKIWDGILAWDGIFKGP